MNKKFSLSLCLAPDWQKHLVQSQISDLQKTQVMFEILMSSRIIDEQTQNILTVQILVVFNICKLIQPPDILIYSGYSKTAAAEAMYNSWIYKNEMENAGFCCWDNRRWLKSCHCRCYHRLGTVLHILEDPQTMRPGALWATLLQIIKSRLSK